MYLYCVRENQHPHAYHSLFLSVLSFSPIKLFVTDFLGPLKARIFKFCIRLQKIEVYSAKEKQDTVINFAFFFCLFLFPCVTQM